MNFSTKKIICLILFSYLFCNNIFAQSKTGVYGEEYYQSIIISGGANYYFGDIEAVGFFSGNHWQDQVNFFGQIGYSKEFKGSRHFKYRADLLAGALHGKGRGMTFKSIIVEPDFVIECYPFKIGKKICNCRQKILGLYLFGGVGFAISAVTLDATQTHYGYFHKNISLAPMLRFGGGYKHKITPTLELGFEIGCHFVTFIDNPLINLDGYPFKLDNGFTVGEQGSKWDDRFYTVGLTLSYSF